MQLVYMLIVMLIQFVIIVIIRHIFRGFLRFSTGTTIIQFRRHQNVLFQMLLYFHYTYVSMYRAIQKSPPPSHTFRTVCYTLTDFICRRNLGSGRIRMYYHFCNFLVITSIKLMKEFSQRSPRYRTIRVFLI